MSRAYKFHNKEGLYFISFATVAWVDVFTRVMYKQIIVDSLRYCQEHKGLVIYSWCLMTNHMHLIIRQSGDGDISAVVGDFKRFTSRQILRAIRTNPRESRRVWMLSKFAQAGNYNSNNDKYQFWQQDNRPIELWSAKVIEQKECYIHMNPVVAGIVDKPEDYLYSSAHPLSQESFIRLAKL